MKAPTNLKECIDVAAHMSMPANKVAAAFNLDFPEFEIEGAIAERLAHADDHHDILKIAVTAPNQASLGRALNRLRAKFPEKELTPPELQLLEQALRFIEELHQEEFEEIPTLSDDAKTEIREMISEQN